MIIEKKYQLDKITDHADAQRPTLEHIKICKWDEASPNEEQGDWPDHVAVATDGWTLAIVPVEVLDNDTHLGLVHGKLLKEARKNSVYPGERDKLVFHLNQEDMVTFFNLAVMPRFSDVTATTNYPDFRSVIPKTRPEAGTNLNPYAAFDIFLLHNLVLALGNTRIKRDYNPIVVLSFTNGQQGNPLMVEPSPRNSDIFVPPFGLIMPMHANDKMKERYYENGKVILPTEYASWKD